MSSLNEAELKILAIAPKPLALVSFFCAFYTVIDICRCPVRRHKVYHRLVLAMMSVTAINCICWFIGTWAMPANRGVYQAHGTAATCKVQGSFILFGANCAVLYYCMQSIFFYIAVNCDFKEERLRKYEPWLHVLPWLFPAIWTAIGIAKDYMKPAGPWCLLSSEIEHKFWSPACYNKECPRDNFYIMFTRIVFVLFCLSFFTATIMVFLAYQIEKKKVIMNSKKIVGKKILVEKLRKEKARQAMKQGLFYLISFYTCIFTSTVSRIIQSNNRNKVHFPTLLIGVLAVSSQGIILFLVYDRTRLRQKVHENNQDDTEHRHNSITTVADIENNILTNKRTTPTPRRNSLKKIAFSIFDGTSSSSVWAEFIHSSDEADEASTCGPSAYSRETIRGSDAEKK